MQTGRTKMKIAIHNAQMSYHIGGTERLIYYQIVHLLNLPIEICLITSKTKNPSPFYKALKLLKNEKFIINELDGVESLGISTPYNSNDAKRWHYESMIFGANAAKFYEGKFFDIVVTHFSTDSMYIPKEFTNVLHLHGCPSDYSEIGDLALDRPNALIAVSEYVRNRWIELYPKLKNGPFFVVYPGIDVEKFQNFKKLRTNDILFVGRLILIKGIYSLLDALASSKLIKKAILIGDGPEKENIEYKLEQLNLREKVKILSNVTDEKLLEFYNSSKILVFPSYAKEGMGLTMLEAGSCGCVLIVSNCCSMPEFLKHGDNGFLFEPNNSKQLVERIDQCLLDEALRNKLSNKASSDIKSAWTNEIKVLELYNKYKEIIKHG